MTPQQRTLARHRLRLGIVNVGFWVIIAAAGVFWFVCGDTRDFTANRLGLLSFAALAVQSMFDFIGGALLKPEPRPSMGTFLRSWSRGALVHTMGLTGAALLSFASFRLTGGFCLAILVGTAALALGRRQLLWAVAGVSTQEMPHAGEAILAARTTSPTFTGGIVGFGRHAQSLLPERWLESLPEPELAAEMSRREWQMKEGLPWRSLLLVSGWNLLGGGVGTLALTLAERPPATAMLGHVCWMTLWAFAGLLILPAFSRHAVFAADRAAADSGCDPRDWIERFPSLVGEDGSSTSAVQTIFYPIPSAERRLRHLEKPLAGCVPGNLARSNLYYSWATLTPLGRAVHCNVGCPELWVFPPSA
ncbi:MAG: hypothetical protein RIS92_1284 [Verrucomicrobiota bacterium]|jgi:hypothetical protein